jgi:hypothetical protein
MVWAGTPVRNLPTRVRYLSAAEGGVSHFHVVRDTARISWLHSRLVFGAAGRALASIARPGKEVDESRPTRSEAKPSGGRGPSANDQ